MPNPERYIEVGHTLWNGANRWGILVDQADTGGIGGLGGKSRQLTGLRHFFCR